MSVKALSNGALSAKAEDNTEAEESGQEELDSERILTTDEVFHILQNERRRRILMYLREHDEGDGVDMRDIVEWVAAQEHNTTVNALRSKERQRVYIALYQSHLPKLDDYNLVEYDQRRGWVTLTDAAQVVFPYLMEASEVLEESDEETEEWSRTRTYNTMALGGSAALLTAAWLNVSVLAAVGDLAVGALIFVAFAVSLVSQHRPVHGE